MEGKSSVFMSIPHFSENRWHAGSVMVTAEVAWLMSHLFNVGFLLGWEGVWNRGPRVGQDQGLLLVASYGSVLEEHLEAPGHVRHAMGTVVWRWQILRGESAFTGQAEQLMHASPDCPISQVKAYTQKARWEVNKPGRVRADLGTEVLQVELLICSGFCHLFPGKVWTGFSSEETRSRCLV